MFFKIKEDNVNISYPLTYAQETLLTLYTSQKTTQISILPLFKSSNCACLEFALPSSLVNTESVTKFHACISRMLIWQWHSQLMFSLSVVHVCLCVCFVYFILIFQENCNIHLYNMQNKNNFLFYDDDYFYFFYFWSVASSPCVFTLTVTTCTCLTIYCWMSLSETVMSVEDWRH